MPDPKAEDVATEEEVKEQEVSEGEQETVTSEGDKTVTETTETEDGADEDKGDDEVQQKINEAVGKALAAQSAKLGEARKAAEASARVEAENRFYKEEIERLRNPRKEEAKDPEIKLPPGFDLLPPEAQEDYLEQKRAILELRKQAEQAKVENENRDRREIAREIDATIEDMKEDTEHYPGFSEVYPEIEKMGREDPEFLRAVVANPKRWLRAAYRDLTAEKAPDFAEKEYEKKIEKQRKAQTTRPAVRDAGGTRKSMTFEESFESNWAKHAGGVEEE